MLEYRRQHHHRLALLALQQQGATADTKLSAARNHLVDRVECRCGLDDADVETRLAVIALFLGGVVAGELELVSPFELQGDLFQFRRRYRRLCGQQQNGSQQRHPGKQAAVFRTFQVEHEPTSTKVGGSIVPTRSRCRQVV
jgi:hypothetical protein